jgi:2-keto-4-pentenoate hydratase/2-oxohepta-3-ene-1,7-dioic acid hydratase in catechol pathway
MASVTLLHDNEFHVGKIVCVGINYSDHMKEMGNEKPLEPVLFLKPSTAILNEGQSIKMPVYSKEVHHEIELALLVGRTACNIQRNQWKEYIVGAGIAIDLTLRDIQREARKKGLPWSVSKGFDGSCPISSFKPIETITDIQNLSMTLSVNKEIRQQGNTGEMIFHVDHLIEYISKIFTLEIGDIIITGTPAGVSPLCRNDHVTAEISEIGTMAFRVAEAD